MPAALTAAIIASSAAGSKQRTELSSIRSRSAGPGRGLSGPVAASPSRTMWLTIDIPSWRQQELGQRPRRHAGGRLAGRGALEHVAGVVEAVLEHPGQVGVARSGLGEHLGRRAGVGRHLLGPLGPLAVGDLDGHGRPERAAVADAADQRDLVRLEAHARAAPVAEPAPGQLFADVGRLDRQAGGQSLDHDDEGLAMGFTRGQEAQHGSTLPDGLQRS